MKKVLSVLLVLINFSVFSQNNAPAPASDSLKGEKTYKNAFSVNASAFLEKMFKSGATPDLNTSFIYCTRSFNKYFLRAGLNGWNSKNTQTNIKTSEQVVTNNFYSSASLGCYLTKNLSKSFSVAYGLNLFTAYVDSSVTFITSVDEVKNYAQTMHYGIAPGVMLTYKITNRISVFAEYTLPIKMTVAKTGTNYSLFPDENTSNKKINAFSMQVYNPFNIYLSCSF